MADESDIMVPAGELHLSNFLPKDILEDWIAPLIAEMIGPFALVLLGAGSIMLAYTRGYTEGDALLMIALAHGLAIGLMVAGAGHISGGHYNPAVTIALFLGGRIGLLKSVGYIAAQLIGAVLAALALRIIFDDAIADATKLGLPTINYAGDFDPLIVGRRNGFALEVILTFFLVYVIHGTAVDSRGFNAVAPLAIGLTITMDILLAGPLTGAAMNPARWFGPAVVQQEMKDGWLYILAPIMGGALASIVHNYVFIPRKA
jgi:aquaporin Z